MDQPTLPAAWSRQQNQSNSAASTSAAHLSASWSGYDQCVTGSMLFLIPGRKSFSCRQSSKYFWRWGRAEEITIHTICLPARRLYTNYQHSGYLCGSFGIFQVRNRRIISCAFASYHDDQSWVPLRRIQNNHCTFIPGANQNRACTSLTDCPQRFVFLRNPTLPCCDHYYLLERHRKSVRTTA
jgi:hypothetical protein